MGALPSQKEYDLVILEFLKFVWCSEWTKQDDLQCKRLIREFLKKMDEGEIEI